MTQEESTNLTALLALLNSPFVPFPALLKAFFDESFISSPHWKKHLGVASWRTKCFTIIQNAGKPFFASLIICFLAIIAMSVGISREQNVDRRNEA